jgi:small subunit ribosomal protein S17
MADEEKNENTEEKQDEAVEEKAPEAEEAPKEEAPKDDAPKDDEPKDDEPEATPDAPARSGAQAAASEDADDEMPWKAKRRLERSRQPAEARPQQSPEELAKQRAETRAANIGERSRYRAGKRRKREKGTPTSPAERTSVDRKVRRGTVVSDKADKTITVRIDVARRHPAYEKIVRHSSTLHAHDERNEAGAGDLVQVVETRPLSRNKRWRLTEILEKAK